MINKIVKIFIFSVFLILYIPILHADDNTVKTKIGIFHYFLQHRVSNFRLINETEENGFNIRRVKRSKERLCAFWLANRMISELTRNSIPIDFNWRCISNKPKITLSHNAMNDLEQQLIKYNFANGNIPSFEKVYKNKFHNINSYVIYKPLLVGREVNDNICKNCHPDDETNWVFSYNFFSSIKCKSKYVLVKLLQ